MERKLPETILLKPEVNLFVTLLKKVKEVPWIGKIRGGYIGDVVNDSFPPLFLDPDMIPVRYENMVGNTGVFIE